ncbi:hypothetical protein QNI16_12320 [Cytophagaceae bacterium YF14B1]|uniref:DUF1735 domain-containing protein n=1 Tax=Xanthocytophaga flava TaxID=3048013 RepID=A0AAE3U5X9_9BACT|nr:hypothetical protein [Xanthocytophaga flavus]MDJ1481274.1 hypothetical protein [Xanthocytophaga flavus]
MKLLNYSFATAMRLPLRLLAYVLPVMVLLSSCDSTDGDPLDQTEPFENNGTVNIELVPNKNNYSVAPGQKVILSLKITKATGGNRPQKLRLYETSTVGTKENEAFEKIDLKNTDEQTKTIEYTAPNTNGTTYLYFEVDESGDKYKTTYVTITVGGTEAYAQWDNITLGAQADATASRFASASGIIYTSCDLANGTSADGTTAEGNLKYVDIVYRILPKAAPVTPTLMSNPEATSDTYGFSTSATCEGTTFSTKGGRDSYFAAAPVGTDFASADATVLNGLSVSTSSAKSISVVKGGTYAFLNSDGQKGLIYVNDIPSVPNNGTGTITISVKVLR